MDLLPEEILKEIFYYLDNKSIIFINRTCKKFVIKSLINKYKDFPRKEDKCKLHQIHQMKNKNNHINDYDINNPNINSILSNYIYDSDMKMIRGDIVFLSKCDYDNRYMIFDNKYKLIIFDGLILIDLKSDDKSFKEYTLPEEFRVIENNVSIKYWIDDQLFNWCVFDCYNIWFDHSQVKNQSLTNIKYGSLFGDKNYAIYGLYTNFLFNNKKYYIVCDYISYDGNQIGEYINQYTLEIENLDVLKYITDKFGNILKSDNIQFKTDLTGLFKCKDDCLVIQL